MVIAGLGIRNNERSVRLHSRHQRTIRLLAVVGINHDLHLSPVHFSPVVHAKSAMHLDGRFGGELNAINVGVTNFDSLASAHVIQML